MEGPLITLSIIAFLLLFLGLYTVFRMPRSSMENKEMALRRKRARIQFLIGVVIALAGAFFMYDSVLFGQNTVLIARIVMAIGIVLIGSSFVLVRYRLSGVK